MGVLTGGATSRAAVQRSGFRQVLSSGEVPALKSALGSKFNNLSRGMLK